MLQNILFQKRSADQFYRLPELLVSRQDNSGEQEDNVIKEVFVMLPEILRDTILVMFRVLSWTGSGLWILEIKKIKLN